jgi:hypothetical protein
LKPAQANSSTRPYFEKTLHKNRAGGVVQGEGPEFKPQYLQKKKKKERERWVFCSLLLGRLVTVSADKSGSDTVSEKAVHLLSGPFGTFAYWLLLLQPCIVILVNSPAEFN